jgi:hypothetical protein
MIFFIHTKLNIDAYIRVLVLFQFYNLLFYHLSNLSACDKNIKNNPEREHDGYSCKDKSSLQEFLSCYYKFTLFSFFLLFILQLLHNIWAYSLPSLFHSENKLFNYFLRISNKKTDRRKSITFKWVLVKHTLNESEEMCSVYYLQLFWATC